MAYYYLVAQLPYLNYGQSTWMTMGNFLELCKENLSKKDADLLPYCTLGVDGTSKLRPVGSVFINKWRQREYALALNLAKARAARLKRELRGEMMSGLDVFDNVEAQAKMALSIDNPLEAELVIDKGRWEAIDALIGSEYFGVNVIYAYLLKLRLLERRSAFKTEEGFAEYKALYAGILENAPRAGA